MSFNRDAAWVLVAVVFAAFVLPVLVFYTGSARSAPTLAAASTRS
jgi:hypothetical protein